MIELVALAASITAIVLAAFSVGVLKDKRERARKEARKYQIEKSDVPSALSLIESYLNLADEEIHKIKGTHETIYSSRVDSALLNIEQAMRVGKQAKQYIAKDLRYFTLLLRAAGKDPVEYGEQLENLMDETKEKRKSIEEHYSLSEEQIEKDEIGLAEVLDISPEPQKGIRATLKKKVRDGKEVIRYGLKGE